MISAPLRPRVRQHRLDGIEPGSQVPFLGNKHRASKRVRHPSRKGLWSLI